MPAEVKKEIQLEIGHVLFIDIVGYSKLLINEQRSLLDTLNQIVRNTDEFRNAEAAGRLLKIPTGDGMALVFYKSPEEPVECALEISRALKEHPELRLRMGAHSGPVSGVVDVNERANVAGAGINVAQRIMDCGDAGHILLSKHLAEDLEQYGHWQPHLHDLGECEVKHGNRIHAVNLYTDELGNPEVPQKFKGVSGAVAKGRSGSDSTTEKSPINRKYILIMSAAALIIGAAALSFFLFRSHRWREAATSPTAAPEKSIAVLPFENLSSDKENAYFADGIQDEILTRLSKIADLKVISRTSTQHYKSAPENLPEIARLLGVAHILEGSVQKSGAAVRVNVQLIKAANDSHLWADTFDRELTDVFSVETEVAKAIAEQLRAQLTGQEEQVIAAKPTDNLEAYDAYLRGLAYMLKTAQTAANNLGAQKYLKEAVRLDPKFALGWAQLSYVDSTGYITATLPPTGALREEARQAVETALTLQSNLGEAILAKGSYYYSCLKDYDTAVRYYEQARQFLPNSNRIPESLAFVARRRGEWEQSDAYFAEAERLDPRNVAVLTQHALSYIQLNRFPDALRKLDQVLDITPDDADAIAYKGSIALGQGDLPRAEALLAPLRMAAGDNLVSRIKTYGAILLRQPAEIIVELKEIVTKRDPALAYGGGELGFWLGWAQQVAGDPAAAQESWGRARTELESFLKDQPDNYRLLEILALTHMALGNKGTALTMAERAMAVTPIEKDALAGPHPIEVLARVCAGTGSPDRAIAALQQLRSLKASSDALSVPLTPATLRLDPMFDPLRNDPRFQKLVEGGAPK